MLHKKIVRLCATLLIAMFLYQPVYGVGAMITSKTTSIDGNAMQCGTMDSLKGFIRKPIDPPPSDEYFINFHYIYPDDVMNDFTVWSSFDGNEYDDIMISQTDDRLTAIKGSAVGEIDIRVEPDVWHNFLIHVKADETVSLYINGEQANIGGVFDFPQIGTGRMSALGYIGDLSSATHNGMGYVDNIRVFTRDELLMEEDFNGELADWTFYTTAFIADPPKNIPMPEPLKFSIDAEKLGFPPGEDIDLSVTGLLNDRTPVVMPLCSSLTVESSNPEVIKISQEGDEFVATGVKEGTCVIKARLTYENKEYQVSKELFVSKEPVVYEILLKADNTQPVQGEKTTVSVLAKYTDGSEAELKEGVVLKSSDPAVIKPVTGDVYEVSALKGGDALLTAVCTKDGKALQGTLAFHVSSLKEIEVLFNTNQFFKGNTGNFLLKGILTNDETVDSSELENITCKSDNPQVVTVSVKEGVPFYEVTGIGGASITVTATLGGVTKSKTFQLTAEELTFSKTKSTIYTEEKVAAARRNAEKYQWASSTKYSVMNTANYHITYGYEFLWSLVTDQNIPRSYAVNQPLGCLNCGKAIDKFGNYPYNANHFNAPWKLECPNCRMRFPTNDFAAYYKSGLDQNHNFDPDLADKSLLVNTLYPEKGEKWGVDDGYGYTDEDGNHYTFVAYYNHWHLWHGGVISKAITSLRDAYIYSGNMKYARAGAILLDRIADVYPDMDIWTYKKQDGFLNSDGGTNRGKVIGSIWETGLVENYLTAYDAFFPVLDDPEIVEFLSEKAEQYHLGNKDGAGIRRNIEDGIIRQVYPAVQNAQIRGNNGMHQSTLATAAVVLDSMPETKEWLDFNFKSGVSSASNVTGGNILATFINDVNRDGHGNEAAPGYNQLWLSQYIGVANTLAGYELYPAADLYENPKFRKMFFAMIPLMLTDKYSAIIGDSASTGNPTRYVDMNQTILAYQHYKDPLLAQVIYFLNNNSTEGIHGDIFHEDPEQVAADIQQVIDEYGPLVLKSDNLTGYGLSVLRDGYNITIDLGIHHTLAELPYTASADLETIRSQRLLFNAQDIGDSVQFTFNVL
ncbi:MAG TPA: hypothetical protein DDZ89_13475, partial [Clostridiales bacterium]|nr:hypothetical protein [Clostridiales bacterium]